MMSFKQSFNFDQRKQESSKILKKHSGKVPVIAEMAKNAKMDCDVRHKFLVAEDMTMGQFLAVLRKKVKLTETEALFVYVNDNTLVISSMTIASIYNDYKDQDGFLYLTFCPENTFGTE